MWGNHAIMEVSDDGFNAGCHRANLVRRVPSRDFAVLFYVKAPLEPMTEILRKNPSVRLMFDNGWLHLFALKDGIVSARYRLGLS